MAEPEGLEPEELKGSETGRAEGNQDKEKPTQSQCFLAGEGGGEKEWGGWVGGRRGNRRL